MQKQLYGNTGKKNEEMHWCMHTVVTIFLKTCVDQFVQKVSNRYNFYAGKAILMMKSFICWYFQLAIEHLLRNGATECGDCS
jgi:hypothetical protein